MHNFQRKYASYIWKKMFEIQSLKILELLLSIHCHCKHIVKAIISNINDTSQVSHLDFDAEDV